mmetsp:Transcript_23148/g.17562  ORF Transcript_23148/g.17562 Transcript_23148/m.17562 type:complete len:319 (+) Transcript_23148:16-972(+)
MKTIIMTMLLVMALSKLKLPKNFVKQDIPTPEPGQTCVLSQQCKRTDSQKGADCPDPSDTTVPALEYYEPALLKTEKGKAALRNACPFMDAEAVSCCTDDTAQIIEYNFKSSDAVFFDDCPICASNMKKLWCQYTCNTTKANFVEPLGYEYYPGTSEPKYALTTYRVDPDYACTLFKSCEKESFIAEAALTSAISFLDFIGLNGKDQGHSVIGFEFESDPERTMNQAVYDCNEEFEDNIMDGYENITPCPCTHCDLSCPVPIVDGSISFFDGADWLLVGLVYAGLVIFSILLAVIRAYFERKEKAELEKEEEVTSDQK